MRKDKEEEEEEEEGMEGLFLFSLLTQVSAVVSSAVLLLFAFIACALRLRGVRCASLAVAVPKPFLSLPFSVSSCAFCG